MRNTAAAGDRPNAGRVPLDGECNMSSVRNATSRGLVASLSALLVVTGGVFMGTFSATSTSAAIAGTRQVLDVPNQSLDAASASCELGEYCVTYPVSLTDRHVFQAQVDNPTGGVFASLYDSLGNEVEAIEVEAGGSDFFNVSVSAGAATEDDEIPVTAAGAYSLVVGSDDAQSFSVFAIEIPDALTVVGVNSTTSGTFDDRTTKRIGDYYRDGVQVVGTPGTYVSVTFSKPGDEEASVAIYDSSQEELAAEWDSGLAQIDDFEPPADGLYQIVVEGENPGAFTLTVQQSFAVQSVALDASAVTLKVGEKLKPQLTVVPSNAADTDVSWESSSRKIAKVSNEGVITALKPGKSVVTVETDDGGETAALRVTVKGYLPTSVSLGSKKATMERHSKMRLQKTIAPAAAADARVTWKSSKPKIAKVSAKGVVTALKTGKTTITVTTNDGVKRARKVIIVKK
jgi:uncharacterized protein YjdB